jgi:hypothetical protein
MALFRHRKPARYGIDWLRDGENAVANHHFKEYLKRELSAGLIFKRDQLEEMIERVRERMALQKPTCF